MSPQDSDSPKPHIQTVATEHQVNYTPNTIQQLRTFNQTLQEEANGDFEELAKLPGGLRRKKPGRGALPCQTLMAVTPALPAYRDFGLPFPALVSSTLKTRASLRAMLLPGSFRLALGTFQRPGPVEPAGRVRQTRFPLSAAGPRLPGSPTSTSEVPPASAPAPGKLGWQPVRMLQRCSA